MPEPLMELYVKIGTDDFRKLDAEMSRFDQRAKAIDPSIAKMESGFAKVNKAAMAMGGIFATIGIVKFGNDVLKASTTLDTLNLMLINIEGSQAKATKRFEEFKTLAKAPVLDPFNLSKSYVSLRAINVESGLAISFMKGLGNAMAGVGAGNQQFQNAMYQVVQMAGATKLLGQDLRVINESFPQMRKYLAEAFGTADPEALAKKGVTAVDVMTKLSAIFEKLPRFTGGAQAAQDNFHQSLMLLEGSLGQAVLPSFTKLIIGITDLMDKFNAMPEATKNVIGGATVGLLGIAGAVMAIKGALDLLSLTSGLKALTSIAGATAGGGITGSAGAGVAAGAGGGAIAGAVAKQGLTIGTALITIGKLSIIAGTVAMAYDVAKRIKDTTPVSMDDGRKVIGGTQFDRGGSAIQFSYEHGGSVRQRSGLMTYSEIAEDYKRNVAANKDISTNKYTSNMFAPFSPTSAIALTPEQTEKLKKDAEEIKKKADEWAKFLEDLNTLAYPPKAFPPDTLEAYRFPRSITEYEFRKEPSIPKAKEYTPSMPGGVPFTYGADISRAGLTSGLGLGTEVSKASQERFKSIEHVQKIEKDLNDKWFSDWQKGFNDTAEDMVKLDKQWNDFVDDMGYGIEEVGREWDRTIQSTLNKLNVIYGLTTPILKEAGLKGRTGERIGDVLSGAAQGAAIGSAFGPWGTGIGAGIGAISGYFKGKQEDEAFRKAQGYAEGGWIMKPTIALMGEREPELIIPKSKMGQGGFGGTSFGDINVYITSPTASVSEVKRNVYTAIKEMVAEGQLNRAVVN